jgi:hypothetical protein
MMKRTRRHQPALWTLAVAFALFAVTPASAQTQLLQLEQDVPLAAVVDNPCTSGPETIAFTGTAHITQEVWLMPGGTTRLVVSESSSLTGKDLLLGLLSPTYSSSGADFVDAEFNPGAATIYNYKKVVSSTGQDNFHTIIAVDFDPQSLRLNLGVQAACDDGSTPPPETP